MLSPNFAGGVSPQRTLSPLRRFLIQCHAEFKSDHSGAVADYIPQLKKANSAHFGVSLATIDGHVYEVGDSAVPFTIQSISKAFVFALALEMLGADKVEAVIGVEPSGDAFNSIRLRPDNRPYNPMVNSGAIACSALIHKARGREAFDCILAALGRFAGRTLDVDEAVFESERETGDRNRAIAYLLRNYAVVEGDVDAVLDVYFRQCSVLVTARDLAVMAATLANNGFNPVTGEQVMKSYAVARTLSIMTSSGMYDYAGEWVYRVGMPAKSGVGGGIVAALPAQLGLGTFSPPLDEHGNSVRGLKSARCCRRISACTCSTAPATCGRRSWPITISAASPRGGAACRANSRSSKRTTPTSGSSNWSARILLPPSIMCRGGWSKNRRRFSSLTSAASRRSPMREACCSRTCCADSPRAGRPWFSPASSAARRSGR
jgi:glutaminase A